MTRKVARKRNRAREHNHENNNLENNEQLLDTLSNERRNDFKLSTRDKLNGMSRAIEMKAMRMLPEGPREGRPYGFPPNWKESERDQIWEKILEAIDVPEDVINLSETCVLFQRLLWDKFLAAKLAEAAVMCAMNAMLSFETLLDLRYLNRTAKNSIDQSIMEGKLYVDSWCSYYVVPKLSLKVAASSLTALRQVVSIILQVQKLNTPRFPSGTFPLREVVFDEENALDDYSLPPLRDSVQRLFGLVGESIHTVTYYSKQTSQCTYDLLRRWIALLPNLEELTVGILDQNNSDIIKPSEPFPTVPRLKRFCEDVLGGFSIDHVRNILMSNPGLELVKLSDMSGDRLSPLLAGGLLNYCQLDMFGYCSNSVLPHILPSINWPLTKLELMFPANIRVIFGFINQFGATLKELRAILIIGTCGCIGPCATVMDLPHLTKLYWMLDTDQALTFMTPLKNLEYFDIMLSEKNVLEVDGTLRYLEKFRVPSLYPAMKRIRVKRQRSLEGFKTIWTKGGNSNAV